MSFFRAVPIPGLDILLNTACEYNEVREVIKFLVIIVVNMPENDAPFGLSYFYLGQAGRYPPSTILDALLQFHENHFAFFEGAVRNSLYEELTMDIPMRYNNAAFIEVKKWLIECACAADTNNILGEKLAEFRAPQPTPVDTPFDVALVREPSLFPIPDMAKALRRLVNNASARGETVPQDDLLHVLREFMRVGMNCGEIWQEYGPPDWDFERNGMPVLSTLVQFTALTRIRHAWREMIRNPFSEAPLHVREVLAECNIAHTLWLFLIETRQVFQFIPWPAWIRMDRMTQHLVMAIQHAAEDWNFAWFFPLRQTRLHSPFEGPHLPAPASPLTELDVDRQPKGEAFLIHGLPQPYELLPADAIGYDMVLEAHRSGIVSHDQFEAWLYSVQDEEDSHRNFTLPSPMLTEGSEPHDVYDTELTLAEPPNLVAVGPRYDPRAFGQAISPSDLQSDDMCFVCTCELLTDEDRDIVRLPCRHLVHVKELDELINGAYWIQDTVGCGMCRQKICDTRPTEEVEVLDLDELDNLEW